MYLHSQYVFSPWVGRQLRSGDPTHLSGRGAVPWHWVFSWLPTVEVWLWLFLVEFSWVVFYLICHHSSPPRQAYCSYFAEFNRDQKWTVPFLLSPLFLTELHIGDVAPIGLLSYVLIWPFLEVTIGLFAWTTLGPTICWEGEEQISPKLLTTQPKFALPPPLARSRSSEFNQARTCLNGKLANLLFLFISLVYTIM